VRTECALKADAMRIVCVHNQKGGVGKTTTVQYLAYNLAAVGRRVLVVDSDPQANLTAAFGIDPAGVGLVDALRGEIRGDDNLTASFIRPVRERIDILSSCAGLRLVQEEMSAWTGSRAELLGFALKPLATTYDYALIDSPPGAGWLVVNGLAAADQIVAPVKCEAFSIDGIHGVSVEIERVGASLRRKGMRLDRIVATMVDRRVKEQGAYLDHIRKINPGLIAKTEIRIDARIPAAQTDSKESLGSRAATDYAALAKELFDGR